MQKETDGKKETGGEQETAIDKKAENTANGMIFQTLPQDMLMQVAQYTTAKEVWNSIKVKHLGANLVQKARLQTLRKAVGRLTAFEERIKSQDTLEANDQDKLLLASSNNQSHCKGRGKHKANDLGNAPKRKAGNAMASPHDPLMGFTTLTGHVQYPQPGNRRGTNRVPRATILIPRGVAESVCLLTGATTEVCGGTHSAMASCSLKVDKAWDHVTQHIEGNGKKAFICNFCLKIIRGGGINRVEEHLVGRKGDVAPCTKVDPHVRFTMEGLLKENDHKLKQRGIEFAESNVISDDDEEQQPYTKIINERWDKMLRTSIHCAAYWLNLTFQFDRENLCKKCEVFQGVLDMAEKHYFGDELTNLNKAVGMFRDSMGNFGRISVVQGRTKHHSDEWLHVDKRSYNLVDYECIDETDFWVVEEEAQGELDYDQLENMLKQEPPSQTQGLVDEDDDDSEFHLLMNYFEALSTIVDVEEGGVNKTSSTQRGEQPEESDSETEDIDGNTARFMASLPNQAGGGVNDASLLEDEDYDI
ncbi:zinc finger, CCHC-type containing protein [Tanacetum coccineum]